MKTNSNATLVASAKPSADGIKVFEQKSPGVWRDVSPAPLTPFEDLLNPHFYIHSLRNNSNLTNYSALCDIIDNSLEPNVKSSFVKIDITQNQNKTYEQILIIDDGIGMTLETLKEAIKLGSDTNKDQSENLGTYGIGLKHSSLSMAKGFQIFTKTKDGDLYVATLDTDELQAYGLSSIGYKIADQSEKDWFKYKTDSEHGTIIRLYHLDRVTNKDVKQFSNTLIKELGVTYRYFLLDGVRLYVNGRVVEPVDPMERELPCVNLELEDTIEHDGITFKVKLFAFSKDEDRKLYEDRINYPVNSKNSGLWIYRNDRLVGKGLDLGLFSDKRQKDEDGGSAGFKHPSNNRLRLELKVSGEADLLLGVTNAKIITEKSHDMMDQGLHDKLRNLVAPRISELKLTFAREAGVDQGITDDQLMKSIEAAVKQVDTIPAILNDFDKWIKPGGQKPGQRPKSDKPDTPKATDVSTDTIKKKIGTFTKKVRWETEDLGTTRESFVTIKRDPLNRVKIVYNSRHVAWKQLSKLSPAAITFVTYLFVAMAEAQGKIGYWSYDNTEAIKKPVDLFLEELWIGLAKTING